MNWNALEPVRTAGRRLALHAEAIATRHRPALSWLPPLARVAERISSLRTPGGARFRRVEAQVAGIPEPAVAPEPQEWAGGTPLESDVRARLGEFIGPQAAAIRVHQDARADAKASAHAADAVTVGRDIYFRRGRFRPREEFGFALLAHDAVHAAQALRPNAAWRMQTARAAEEHEQEARRVERSALSQRRPSPASFAAAHRAPAATTSVPLPAVSASSPALRPAAAPAGRTQEPLAAPAAAPGFDELRNALYRDLMARIKADFERGG